ncbi:MBL fold metallo-hydrolase [Clostridium gasigenes]|uniref:MBL fold metallo-hydrolase n=1 Tax=Clostridium gasigenes TaxID=94869 RepID=A0A7X0SED8_9CLOT|nr:MBL fold metallo-hydrolase [Clostridium gasigenes]MBB6716079.1 MBL fold metallo-hydrolase [Clostridium gasigenes]
MDNWFTIEKIDDMTFAISEYGHWEKVHSYLLIGTKYALLIDTGLGIGNIKNEVDKLTSLPVKVITTHCHWDHIGGHKYFKDIYIHEDDAEWLKRGLPIPIEVIRNSIVKEPFSKETPKKFDIKKYTVYKDESTKILKDNYIIDIGSRKVRVLHTPGHSPGHICLFEEEKGYLYTGDLIYLGTLYAFYPSTNPIEFKKSIEKICCLNNITKILPGHNELDLKLDIIRQIQNSFILIEKNNLLEHGSGTFDFGDFKIQL